jgi:hypothetical protein
VPCSHRCTGRREVQSHDPVNKVKKKKNIFSDLLNRMQQSMSASKYLLVMFFKTCNLCSFLEAEVEQPAWKAQA